MRCTVADKQNIQLSMVLISASLSPAAARRLMIFNCEWEKALGELKLLGATYSPQRRQTVNDETTVAVQTQHYSFNKFIVLREFFRR